MARAHPCAPNLTNISLLASPAKGRRRLDCRYLVPQQQEEANHVVDLTRRTSERGFIGAIEFRVNRVRSRCAGI